MPDERQYCPRCGWAGEPVTVTPGSYHMEIVLWICFLAPGLLYSLWRLHQRHQACPSCHSSALIPAQSPAARASMQALGIPPAPPPAKVRPSKAAYGLGHALGRLFRRQ